MNSKSKYNKQDQTLSDAAQDRAIRRNRQIAEAVIASTGVAGQAEGDANKASLQSAAGQDGNS